MVGVNRAQIIEAVHVGRVIGDELFRFANSALDIALVMQGAPELQAGVGVLAVGGDGLLQVSDGRFRVTLAAGQLRQPQ